MAAEVFVALFGLATALTAHTYFYLSAYREESGFTGLLETEEHVLMDSMVAMGGIQVLYFLWRYLQTALDASSASASAVVNILALGLLIVFAYHSYLLVENMKDAHEAYGFEVDIK